MKILSEISAGELLDKITILEIKIDKIKNEDDKKEVLKEYKSLKKTQEDNIEFNEEIKKLYNDLKQTNSKLWEIEDKLRIFEKRKNSIKNLSNWLEVFILIMMTDLKLN